MLKYIKYRIFKKVPCEPGIVGIILIWGKDLMRMMGGEWDTTKQENLSSVSGKTLK